MIIAEAYRDAQRVKGEGDAKATGIYAKAYGENAEFYSFYRSLEAYRSSFRSRSDVVVSIPPRTFSGISGLPARAPASRAPASEHRSDRVRLDAGDRRPPAFACARALARDFRRILQFSDGQIRFFGLSSMLAGLLLFVLGRA